MTICSVDKLVPILRRSPYRDNLTQRYIFFNFIIRGGGAEIGTSVAIWGRIMVLGTIFDKIDKIRDVLEHFLKF